MFFRGDAKECRVRVQALNERCHQTKNALEDRKLELIEMREEQQQNQQQGYYGEEQQDGQAAYQAYANGAAPLPASGYYQMGRPAIKQSRWAKYLDENDEPF